MLDSLIKSVRPKMDNTISFLDERLKGIRTGGAQASLVENIGVSYYGTTQPLKTLAQITTPEPNLILIQPFDRQSIGDIRLAIINADLGFNPSDDGHVLRILVPPLTAERREELSKMVKKIAEEGRIGLRTIREECWKEVQRLHREKQIADDDRTWAKDELDKIIDEYNCKIEEKVKVKQESLMSG